MAGIASLLEGFRIVHENSHRADFSEGISEEEIQKCQELIGREFPASYKLFLRKLGCGDIAGQEFYGASSGRIPGTTVPSAIWCTLENRKAAHFPLDYLIIADTGYGPIMCLDLGAMKNDECPIVLWDSSFESKAQAEPIAADFGQFFLDQISTALKEEE